MKPSFRFGCVVVIAGLCSGASAQDIPFPRRPMDTTTLEKMRSGTVSVGANANNQKLIDDLSIWLADRLAHPPFNGKEPPTKTLDDIETLMDEVNRWCVWPNPRQPANEMQLEYARALGKSLSKRIMSNYEILGTRLEKLNAARMLAVAGKLPDAELADVYLKIIRDNAYPMEVKRFAFEGLRNLLSVSDPTFPAQHFIKSAPKLAEIANELEKFITFKCAAGLPPDDARVIQYIRREAVRAMASFKVAVVRQQAEPLAKPIMTLLRVATNDKYINPSDHALPGYGYNPLERMEAVIGICSMIPDRNQNLELVVWLVNDALIDMGAFQAKERTDFQKDARNKPLIPWRITGVRMVDALANWKKAAAPLPQRLNPKVVLDYADAVTKIVARWEAEGVNAQPDYRAFDDWKRDKTRLPKAPEVISDDPTSKIDLPTAGKAELKK